MDDADKRLSTYGQEDGPWLREELRRYTQDLSEVKNVRIARVGDEAEMARFREMAEEGEDQAAKSDAVAGDWEVVSPHTGRHYMMGCDYRVEAEEQE